MEPKVIWIKIDPSLLIEGFDYQGFFGDDSFLKFNITPDETDIDPGTTNVNSTNHPNVKGDGLEITSSEKKSEQKFDQETATLLRSKTNNRQGIPSSCSECGLTASSVASLKEHVKVFHNKDLRFPCDHCEKRFTRKSLLEHKRFIVGKESKVSCGICAQNHETRNHRDPVAQCKDCSKKFLTKKNFDWHMLQALCDPAKWKKRRLERQMEAARSGQFNCTFEKCDKQYLTKNHLDRHTMTHTNERPYQCDNCGMAFNQKGSLKEHLRVHTGEKPYQCQVCPNAYAQGGAFKAHLKTHDDANSDPDGTEVKT